MPKTCGKEWAFWKVNSPPEADRALISWALNCRLFPGVSECKAQVGSCHRGAKWSSAKSAGQALGRRISCWSSTLCEFEVCYCKLDGCIHFENVVYRIFPHYLWCPISDTNWIWQTLDIPTSISNPHGMHVYIYVCVYNYIWSTISNWSLYHHNNNNHIGFIYIDLINIMRLQASSLQKLSLQKLRGTFPNR